MIRTTLTLALLAAAALPAQAISRYNSESMSCSSIHAKLQQEGAAILSHRAMSASAPPLYDRYVASQQYCESNEVTRTTFVPASDGASCPVMECIEYERPDFGGR